MGTDRAAHPIRIVGQIQEIVAGLLEFRSWLRLIRRLHKWISVFPASDHFRSKPVAVMLVTGVARLCRLLFQKAPESRHILGQFPKIR